MEIIARQSFGVCMSRFVSSACAIGGMCGCMRRRCAHSKADPLRIEGSLKGQGSLTTTTDSPSRDHLGSAEAKIDCA